MRPGPLHARLVALVPVAALVAASAGTAAADPTCGNAEIRFQPGAGNLQTVVWIEDTHGNVIDTPWVTRLIGQFGLGNRPGSALLKTDFGWPYGRREMVFPIWAHHRDHHYHKVVMGGACGYLASSSCPSGGTCGGGCDDTTIAYHSVVSSTEPFYCSPSGASRIDAMSCASKGTFSKGAWLPFPANFSLYPPRADLTSFDVSTDSADARNFAREDDLVAVSQATPPAAKPGDQPLVVPWYPQNLPPGDYVALVELSQESDFNNAHNHPNMADTVSAWDFEGHPFLGQPSVVYKVPFHYDASGQSAIATQYAGYSTWDGSDGVLHPPDGTITVNRPGSGAGRLLDVNDGINVYRVKVVVGTCIIAPPPDMAMHAPPPDMTMLPPPDLSATVAVDGGAPLPDLATTTLPADAAADRDASFVPFPDGGIHGCTPPDPVTDLVIAPGASALDVSWRSAAGGAPANRFSVRYMPGAEPITDGSFDTAIAAPSATSTGPGGTVMSVHIPTLQPATSYAVAVRAIAPCGKGSRVASLVGMTTQQTFAVLHGCFIATAAFGSPMQPEVATLRRFRDERLLTNPAGSLAVATYYAFSPPLANAVAGDERLRAMARRALEPVVNAVKALAGSAARP